MKCKRPRALFALVLPILIFLASSCAQAQQAVSPDVAALLKRIDELEQRVKSLEAAKPAQAETAKPQEAMTMSATAASPAAVPAVAQESHEAVASMDMGGMTMPEHNVGAMKIQGFADVGWLGSDIGNKATRSNSFYVGQMNLFITSRLTDKSSIIAETVFEADSKNSYGVDLERLLYNYVPNEYVNLSVGRFHSAIGYYNTAYHHSSWMQTAMDRPMLFAFEDNGGILPIHNVGVSVNGRIPSGNLGLHYLAEVGNGRTSRSVLDESTQSRVDENNRKSTNLGFYLRPQRIRGLQAGFNWYNDNLAPQGMPHISENIYAAHAVYQTSQLELLNEVVLVSHTPVGGRTYHTPGWYSQIAPQFRHVRPYFRYQYINASASEPIYQDVGLNHGPSFGARFNVSEFSAFKVQYDRGMYRDRPSTNGLGAQLSFAF